MDDLTSACLIRAVFWICFLSIIPYSSSINESAIAIPPVSSGTEKDVPYFFSHLPTVKLTPEMPSPSTSTSGFGKPAPSRRALFVMPRELK